MPSFIVVYLCFSSIAAPSASSVPGDRRDSAEPNRIVAWHMECADPKTWKPMMSSAKMMVTFVAYGVQSAHICALFNEQGHHFLVTKASSIVQSGVLVLQVKAYEQQ